MHTVFALLCFVVVIHWLIFPYPSGLLHWHCGNLTIAPVPAKQPWWIWINTSCEFIMNDCITTTKQSTTKPCAYFLGYTVHGDSIISVTLRMHKPSLLGEFKTNRISQILASFYLDNFDANLKSYSLHAVISCCLYSFVVTLTLMCVILVEPGCYVEKSQLHVFISKYSKLQVWQPLQSTVSA